MGNKCERCGSYAINHHCHGRDGTDRDLCDACYWRKRAEALQIEHVRLAEEVAALREDAGRYRWLRNEAWGGHVISKRFPHVVEYKAGFYPRGVLELAEGALDTAIDAARNGGNE